MVKTNHQTEFCQDIGGVTICRYPESTEKDQDISPSKTLVSDSMKGEDIFRTFFFSSPYPAFLFRKGSGRILLLDCTMTALTLVSEDHDGEEFMDTGHIMGFFARLPEMLSAVMECFSHTTSFSREICTIGESTNPPKRYRCFKCTFCPVDSSHVVVYLEAISSLILEMMRLHRKKTEFDKTMNMVQCGTWEWSISSGALTTNSAWTSMLDYESHEIRKDIQSWEKLIHPEDHDKVVFSLFRHINGDSPSYYSEHRLINKKGKSVWVRDCGKIIARASDGTPVLALGGKINISEQKQIDSQAQRQAQKFLEQLERQNQIIVSQERNLQQIMETNESQLLQIDALKQKIKKREHDIHPHITQTVFPCIERLHEEISSSERRMIAHILEESFKGLHHGISKRFLALKEALTPTEGKIVNYIQYGKTTKEIADLLCVSTKTIKTHRRNIRRKLGLQGKKQNLTSYLRSL